MDKLDINAEIQAIREAVRKQLWEDKQKEWWNGDGATGETFDLKSIFKGCK